jgi:hypothetical protein
MLPEDNPLSRIGACTPGEMEPVPRTTDPDHTDPYSNQGAAEGQLRAPSANVKKSIDVVFDLSDPEQAKKLEWHRAAFGDDHAEVEPLGGGKVVLKLYPGAAKRPR